jgi:trehalose 6-phosphate synthase/phosphatase
MNLIAKEYVAAKNFQKEGVLILSETAGASKELGEAIIINPNTPEEISDAISKALNMSKKEQADRLKSMNIRLSRNTVTQWGNRIIDSLTTNQREQDQLSGKNMTKSDVSDMMSKYKKSVNRLIFLDYDGTLVPFSEDPGKARPSLTTRRILNQLLRDRRNLIVIISGRTKAPLDKWFKKLPMGLAAEHGSFIRDAGSDWVSLAAAGSDWKPDITPIFERYVDKLPGSYIEDKESAVAWHYRKSDRFLANIYAKDLVDELTRHTAGSHLQILHGNKVVEVKSTNINKGTAALHWLTQSNYDFVFGIGDDLTDEDLFTVLPAGSYSVKVGFGQTNAKFILNSQSDVRSLLGKFSRISELNIMNREYFTGNGSDILPYARVP